MLAPPTRLMCAVSCGKIEGFAVSYDSHVPTCLMVSLDKFRGQKNKQIFLHP